jgi:aminoglycoside phosphotransferase (APT) family kinase protein
MHPEIPEGAHATAEEAVAQSVEASALTLTPREGGLTNVVFEAETPRGRVIVRLGSPADKTARFGRERVAMVRASEAGIPTPDVYGVGAIGEWAYMVAQCLPGEPAMNHPLRIAILEEVGRMTARIHAIRTQGHGPAFSWTEDEPAAHPSWSDWLMGEMKAEERLHALSRSAMLSARQFEIFSDTLKFVANWNQPPVLNHGDLRLKNVLADNEGRILGIIDWECCISSIGPHWDLSLALHDLWIDAKEAFLAGYGLDEQAIRDAAPIWRLFNVLNYAPRIEALTAAGDTRALERMRSRLSGALELYSVS